jgi:hypothetical protein
LAENGVNTLMCLAPYCWHEDCCHGVLARLVNECQMKRLARRRGRQGASDEPCRTHRRILDIKREKGWTWKYVCEQIGGMSPALVTGALLGQMKQLPRSRFSENAPRLMWAQERKSP